MLGFGFSLAPQDHGWRPYGGFGWLEQRVAVCRFGCGPGVAFVFVVGILGGDLESESPLELVAEALLACGDVDGVAGVGLRVGDGGQLIGEGFGFSGGERPQGRFRIAAPQFGVSEHGQVPRTGGHVLPFGPVGDEVLVQPLALGVERGGCLCGPCGRRLLRPGRG